MSFLSTVLIESWNLLLDAAFYILFGLLIGGLVKVFLSPAFVLNHMGRGRISSVLKAALFGIPIPLCSCGVLPAAAALKRQGANNGATAAFLISTPESGVDSVAITYALLDPIMTVARPVAAFLSAAVAGITENIIGPAGPRQQQTTSNMRRDGDACFDTDECKPEQSAESRSLKEKMTTGLKYAATDLWEDIAGWFMLGILLGGFVTAMVPDDFMSLYLGGGFLSMLIMLAVGVPLYICATASTPIAAALILKGLSPGAALVFLLAGPATNITSLSVIAGLLGGRTTIIYLATVALVSVSAGLLVDEVYAGLGISAKAAAGQAAEMIPFQLQLGASMVLLAMSVRPLFKKARSVRLKFSRSHEYRSDQGSTPSSTALRGETASGSPAPT